MRSISWSSSSSLRGRLKDSLPLVAIGAAFLAGAALASADHLRLLTSPYPLWILLALNGVVAAAAGTTAVFVAEPDRPIDDDPEIVRVPRVEWESLLRRLESASRTPGTRPSVPEWYEPERPAPRKTRVPEPPVAPPAVDSFRSEVDPVLVRREMALLELESVAESAISTGENLGADELQNYLDTSAEELTRLSRLVGEPRALGESPSALLVRLLRAVPSMEGLPPGRFSTKEMEKLAGRIRALIPETPTATPAPAAPPPKIRSAADEMDELLKELEADTDTPAPRPRRTGKADERPPKKKG